MIKKFANTALVASLALFTLTATARAMEVSFETDSSLPIVYVNVAVKAGAVNDPNGQSGLSSFTAKMLLRGTRVRSKDQIDLALDQMGARLEVETRAEAVILRGAVATAQLVPFLQLMGEVVTQPSFAEREIRKLKNETRSEILDERGNDGALAGRLFNEFLFRGHPYGKPINGVEHDVMAFTRAKIQAQYQKLFRDPNLLVVGTGDANSTQVGNWANALTAKLPKGGSPIEKVSMPVDAPTRRLLIVDKPGRTQTQINAGQIGVRMTDPDYFPLYTSNYAFAGGSFTSRMMVELRVKRGWTYGAYASFRQGREPRSWHYHLFPGSKDTPNALKLSLQMVSDLSDKGITTDELTSSKQALVNRAGFDYNTPKKRVENKLLERTLDLPDGFMKTYAAEISKVTLDQANTALKKFFKPNQIAITVVATAADMKDKLAEAAGVPVSQVEVIPWNEDAKLKPAKH